MLYEIFPFPYAPLIATLVWAVGIGLVGHFAVFRLRLFDSLLKAPMAPPFMALPAILFAFLLAFMASAAWQNISLARASLVNEHTALARLATVPIGPAAAKQQMQAGLKAILTAVLDDEWARRYNEFGVAGGSGGARLASTPASGPSPASARDKVRAPTAPAISPSRPTSRRSTTCARRARRDCRSATRARCG